MSAKGLHHVLCYLSQIIKRFLRRPKIFLYGQLKLGLADEKTHKNGIARKQKARRCNHQYLLKVLDFGKSPLSKLFKCFKYVCHGLKPISSKSLFTDQQTETHYPQVPQSSLSIELLGGCEVVDNASQIGKFYIVLTFISQHSRYF
jgi:hypothetical protein